MDNRVGLHARLDGPLDDIVQKALRLRLPFFQCFFVLLSTGKLIKLTKKQIDEFLAIRHKYFGNLYVHGSYWINLAGIKYNGHRALKRELDLAKKLAFTHMVLHPGSAKGARDKLEGIDALARALNTLLMHEHEIKIVLENTAHGNMSVGSDINDFGLLLKKIDHPDKLFFSLDTSHAYSYGYDISLNEEQDAFIDLVDHTMGLDRVVLIHLNDSSQKCGSRIDRHAVPGEGRIGEPALKRFMLHKKLIGVPVILELPVLSEKDEETILQKVRSWHK